MTKKKTTTKKPSHEVFQVLETGSEKSYWNRIGAAWQHEDGAGLNVMLNVLPLDGRLVIRTVKAEQQ